MATKIVARYKNYNKWKCFNNVNAACQFNGPPLERMSSAADVVHRAIGTGCPANLPFAGVEVSNELNIVTCGPPYYLNATSLNTFELWKMACGGAPYSWSRRYWDGTPLQTHTFIVDINQALEIAFPDVSVGGPAIWNAASLDPLSQTPAYEGASGIMQKKSCDIVALMLQKGVSPAFWSFHY